MVHPAQQRCLGARTLVCCASRDNSAPRAVAAFRDARRKPSLPSLLFRRNRASHLTAGGLQQLRIAPFLTPAV